MKRKHFNITEEQAKNLKTLVHTSDMSMSKHIRRTLDEYLALHLIKVKDDGTYTGTGADEAWIIGHNIDPSQSFQITRV